MIVGELIYNVNWTAVAAIAAVVAAIFAGLAWHNSEKALNYTKAKEAPDLWMKKDVLVFGKYEISQSSNWAQPGGIPGESIVLQQFPVSEIGSDNRFNRTCVILNTSSKSSSNARIDNYTGLFGEIHFENRGTVPIKELKIINCHFKMNGSLGYDLEDFDLTPVGKLDVDIGRGSPLILLVGYLFDNDKHMICDPKYINNTGLQSSAMQKKQMYNDQLRCNLDVIIDLYDEVSFTLQFTAQDGSVYRQKHSIEIRRDGKGGIYYPTVNEAVILKSKK